MKYIVTYLLAVIFYLASSICSIWALIEFIIYLVKDKEFNWWGVQGMFIFLAAAIGMSILAFIIKVKNPKPTKSRTPLKKSKWQQRMDEIQKQRKHGGPL